MVEPEEGVLHVTRTIPVPRSVSEHAQTVLSLTAMFPGPSEAPPADDQAAWEKHAAEVDQTIATALAPQIESVEAEVESRTVDGVPVFEVTPADVDVSGDTPIFLDIHGGGLVYGSGEACRVMAVLSVARSAMWTWSPDYRMPPTHPFPASLDDCMKVYRALLAWMAPERIVVGGASAGGNLAAALLLRARDDGLPMPSCLVLLSPEADLTESGDSFETNLGVDTILTSRLTDSIALYAGDYDLTEPLLSPLFGDLSDFPPTFLQTGTRDLFLSNTVRMHRALRNADVTAELHVFEAMPHGGFHGAPEDQELAWEIRRFIAEHLGHS
jgi:epsilon-lactone hydrolase